MSGYEVGELKELRRKLDESKIGKELGRQRKLVKGKKVKGRQLRLKGVKKAKGKNDNRKLYTQNEFQTGGAYVQQIKDTNTNLNEMMEHSKR